MAMIDHANLPENPADMVLGQVGGKVKVGIVARKQMDDLQRAWSVPDTHWYITRSISLIMGRKWFVQMGRSGRCNYGEWESVFPRCRNKSNLPTTDQTNQ
jgi:hypothetical protein